MFSLVSRLKYGTLCCSIAPLFREEVLCIFAYQRFFFFNVDHFKSLYWICYHIASVLCFFGHKACGISAPPAGIEPALPALESKVLATGPPGKSGSSVLISPRPWELISFAWMFILYLRSLCLTSLLTWVTVFFLWEDSCDLLAVFVLVPIISGTYLRTALTQCPGVVS